MKMFRKLIRQILTYINLCGFLTMEKECTCKKDEEWSSEGITVMDSRNCLIHGGNHFKKELTLCEDQWCTQIKLEGFKHYVQNPKCMYFNAK